MSEEMAVVVRKRPPKKKEERFFPPSLIELSNKWRVFKDKAEEVFAKISIECDHRIKYTTTNGMTHEHCLKILEQPYNCCMDFCPCIFPESK